MSGLGAFTECFVICTGYSTPQLQAICTEIEEVLYRDMKRASEHRSAEWALLDFGGFIVQVLGDKRGVSCDLERLWWQAPSLVLPDKPGAASRNELSEKAG